ncbi:hypothetical protein HanPI659440_Chr07g0255271 [Helianthus annuus]|nr:hypothetical protein HanPI659440_Chr07g0255271 [Helianthus annuus]
MEEPAIAADDGQEAAPPEVVDEHQCLCTRAAFKGILGEIL